MSKVGVIGAGGRMGCELVRCIRSGAVKDLDLAGALESADCSTVGSDAGEVAGIGSVGISITSDVQAVLGASDVVIDFTFHTATAALAPEAASLKKAMVIGTTGLTEDELSRVHAAAQEIPMVMAPNMSLGINLLLVLAHQTSAGLAGKGYDVEIIERHHRKKKDAPSGTALALGHAVADGMAVKLDDVAVHGREGIVAEDRSAEEIAFHAVRGGDFVGDHTVVFAGEGESIELSHRATSRSTFAMGALRAASWVVGQHPGIYSMQDVLQIR